MSSEPDVSSELEQDRGGRHSWVARRWWGVALLLFAVGGIGWRWGLAGLLVPVRVVSGSMAPRLVGPHWEVACPDCGFPLQLGSDFPPEDDLATCSNCGATDIAVRAEDRRLGQRVLIHRGAYLASGPRRWDIVAFEDPQAPGRWSVKRIVGLPGERVGVIDGELQIDRAPLRKSWHALWDCAVPVHDDRYRARSRDADPRWQGVNTGSAWQPTAGGYTGSFMTERVDWLAYHHLAGVPPPGNPRRDSPVTDNYAYNQSLSRPLYLVRDVILRCRIESPRRGIWSTQWLDDGSAWRVAWDLDHNVVRVHDSGDDVQFTCAAPVSLRSATDARGWLWEAARCDGQLLVRINGHAALTWPLPSPAATSAPSATPLRIAWHGHGQARISHPQVWRDLYVTHPQHLPAAWTLNEPLGGDEFFLLGDNSPLADDGRHQPALARLPGRRLIGRVLTGRSDVHVAHAGP